jgi:hypothetical protein
MIKFQGLEAADELFAQTEDVRRAYLSALRQFQDRLGEIVHRNDCEYVLIDTSLGLGDQLLDYLNKRHKLPC